MSESTLKRPAFRGVELCGLALSSSVHIECVNVFTFLKPAATLLFWVMDACAFVPSNLHKRRMEWMRDQIPRREAVTGCAEQPSSRVVTVRPNKGSFVRHWHKPISHNIKTTCLKWMSVHLCRPKQLWPIGEWSFWGGPLVLGHGSLGSCGFILILGYMCWGVKIQPLPNWRGNQTASALYGKWNKTWTTK